MVFLDEIDLATKLIKCESITPNEGGALDLLEGELSSLGFQCQRMVFSQDGTPDVDNLYARYGNLSPNLCFAGHTDVVPTGDINAWSHPPFSANIADNKLYGRGAVDMKGAIACWVSAVKDILSCNDIEKHGSISLLITGDEEGVAINGTKKMLQKLADNNEVLSHCITGEPTSVNKVGDMIKIGRRGSINFHLKIYGKQGHVGYPDLADNAAHKLTEVLHHLSGLKLDDGNAIFQKSTLAITKIIIDNDASNVIPGRADAFFNIRFNNLHTSDDLYKMMHRNIKEIVNDKFDLDIISAFESFLTEQQEFANLVKKSCEQIAVETVFSTTGGTSDSRFIKNYCPVLDLGLCGNSMHGIDEHAPLDDLKNLKAIYQHIIKGYFKL